MTEAVKQEVKTKPCCQKKDRKLIKVTDLPIYGNPYPRCERVQSQDIGYIEGGVKTVREELTPYFGLINKSSERMSQFLTTAFHHSKSTYESITSEGNTIGKAAAITGGGLLGLLVASRRGFFKKILYTSAGLTAASAACYPVEAKELSQIGFFIVTTKGPEIIKEYTGVDLSRKKDNKPKVEPKNIDKIGQEVSDVHYYGFRVSERPSKTEAKPNASKSEVKGDFGMGRKEDNDLYANRSTK